MKKFFRRKRVRITLAVLLGIGCVAFALFQRWLGHVVVPPDDVPLWTIERSEVNRLPAGVKKRNYLVQDGTVSGIEFSPDGKTLKTGIEKGGEVCPFEFIYPPVRWWNVENGKLLRTCPAPLVNAGSIVMSKDERLLATWAGVFDGPEDAISIHVFDVKTGKQLWMKTGAFESDLTFSPDGQLLVGCMNFDGYKSHRAPTGGVFWPQKGAEDKSVKVWDAKTGALKHTLKGIEHTSDSIAFSDDGDFLAVGKDGTVEIWNAKNWTLQKSLKVAQSSCDSIAFFPDAKRLAVQDYDQIAIWDWRTERKLLVIHTTDLDSDEVAISNDGRFIAGSKRVFYPDNGDRLLGRLGIDPYRQQERLPKLREVFWYFALLHPYTKNAQPEKGVIFIWDAQTGKVVKQFVNTNTFGAVAFAPNGRSLASVEFTGCVRLWDTSDLYR